MHLQNPCFTQSICPSVYPLSSIHPDWVPELGLTLLIAGRWSHLTDSLSSPHCCISLRHWRGTHTFAHYTPQRHAVQFTLKRSMLLRLRYMAHQSWMDNHACELRDIESLVVAMGNFSVYLLRLQFSCLTMRRQWFQWSEERTVLKWELKTVTIQHVVIIIRVTMRKLKEVITSSPM